MVRLEATVKGEQLPGTGFLYRFEPPGRAPVMAVVTNKHVRDEATEIRIFFHLATPTTPGRGEINGISFPALAHSQLGWVDHPDPEVDLCAYPCGELIAAAESATEMRVLQTPLDKNLIWSDAKLEEVFSAAEDATMIGFPSGIWDVVHNLPLLRRGMTATHPSLDFCGRPEGLLDIAAIGGSSGSPVVLLSEGIHLNKKPRAGEALLEPGDRLVLLGVASHQVTEDKEGRIEKRRASIRKESYPVTQFPIHLAYYVKAKELLTLEHEI